MPMYHLFDLNPEMIQTPLSVLKSFGNMSSATVLFVLNRFLLKGKPGEWGLCARLWDQDLVQNSYC